VKRVHRWRHELRNLVRALGGPVTSRDFAAEFPEYEPDHFSAVLRQLRVRGQAAVVRVDQGPGGLRYYVPVLGPEDER
jgi:hypothetical protein